MAVGLHQSSIECLLGTACTSQPHTATILHKPLQCPAAPAAPAGQPKADVVEAVHEKLRGVAAALSAGELPLSAFVITKQLTKRPEDYPDAKGQPHVQVGWAGCVCGKGG